MTRIAVRGITDERDALEAAHLGVDALGFIFSRDAARMVGPRQAAQIASRLPPLLTRVGVFVDESPEAVADAVRIAGLSAVQFHGEERPDECRAFGVPWYKTFRLGPRFRPSDLARFACTTYLLELPESWRADADGIGDLGRRVREASAYGRVIVGGPLTAECVESVIASARPYAVEASTGVEFRPGKQDIDHLEAFIEAVRRTDERLRLPGDGV